MSSKSTTADRIVRYVQQHGAKTVHTLCRALSLHPDTDSDRVWAAVAHDPRLDLTWNRDRPYVMLNIDGAGDQSEARS